MAAKSRIRALMDIEREMVVYLKQLGIPAVSIDYCFTNYISIGVQRISEIAGGKALAERHSGEIIAHFKHLVEKHEYECDCSKYEWRQSSVTDIYALDAKHLDSLVRKCRGAIEERCALLRPGEFVPKCIFCHSSGYIDSFYPPGYYVIFSDDDILSRSVGAIQDEVRETILSVLRQHDERGIVTQEVIDIVFSHAEDKDLYYMSRED